MIIKFNPYQTTNQKYNDLLRGRYAWLVRGIKVIPLDQISLEEFMMLERGVDILKEYDIFKFIDIQENIDIDATNRINNISKYLTANSLVPEGSLDVDTLKKFRTKLAEILLSSHKYGDEYDFSCYTDDSSKISNMLTYYANNMIDLMRKSKKLEKLRVLGLDLGLIDSYKGIQLDDQRSLSLIHGDLNRENIIEREK